MHVLNSAIMRLLAKLVAVINGSFKVGPHTQGNFVLEPNVSIILLFSAKEKDLIIRTSSTGENLGL